MLFSERYLQFSPIIVSVAQAGEERRLRAAFWMLDIQEVLDQLSYLDYCRVGVWDAPPDAAFGHFNRRCRTSRLFR